MPLRPWFSYLRTHDKAQTRDFGSLTPRYCLERGSLARQTLLLPKPRSNMKSHAEFVMNKPNIALYAGDSLGESQIANNLAATRQVGWTTVVLGLFHIGYPPDWPEAKIFFNDTGVIDGGKYLGDPSWPNSIAQLKQNGSSVTQI